MSHGLIRRFFGWCTLGFVVMGSLSPAQAQGEDKQIRVHLANEVIPLNSHATTVAGFLDELSINLPQDAFVDPPVNAALNDGMSVFLEGLSVTRGVSTRTVPPRVEVIDSWHCGPERMVIESPGRDGIVESTCTVFFLKGREVGRRQHDNVLREMQPTRVVRYHQLTSEDGPSIEEILEHLESEAEAREQVGRDSALLTHWDQNHNGVWDDDELAAYQAEVDRIRELVRVHAARKRWFFEYEGEVYGAARLTELEDLDEATNSMLVCFDGRTGWVALEDVLD